MIPDIGLMVAAYIISRLAAMLGQPTSETNVIAKCLSVVAILVTVIAVFDLSSHGTSMRSYR
jgi:hypothetical protein